MFDLLDNLFDALDKFLDDLDDILEEIKIEVADEDIDNKHKWKGDLRGGILLCGAGVNTGNFCS